MNNKSKHNNAATTAGTAEWMFDQLLSWDNVPEELQNEIRVYLLAPGDEEIKEWTLRRSMTTALRGAGRAAEMPNHSHEIWSRLMRTLGWHGGKSSGRSSGHSDDSQNSTGGHRSPSWRNVGLRIAAVLIPAALILGVWTMWRGGMLNFGGSAVQTTMVAEGFSPNHIVAPVDSVQHITMADGTRVTLNKGTQLKYDDQRQARLSGEAWFDVAQKEGEPFVVHSDNGRVRVLGTMFNMSTTAGGNTTVSLYKGMVLVEHSRGESLLDRKGREIVIENTANRRGKHRFDVHDFDATDLPAWVLADTADQLEKAERAARTHNQALMQILPLSEIFSIVKQEYGVEIVGEESVDLARTYNFILNPDSSLSGVMAALSYANGEFNYTISGKTVTLRKSNKL